MLLPSDLARSEPIGCGRVGDEASQLRAHDEEDRERRSTHAEGLDGEDDRAHDEVEREEGKDGDRDGVGALLGLGAVAEGEDDLQREEAEICSEEKSQYGVRGERRALERREGTHR